MPWQTLPKLDDLQRWLPSACGGVHDELLLLSNEKVLVGKLEGLSLNAD